MSVRLIAVTPNAEHLIAYCARVSSPQNQAAPADRLLNYCIVHGHWSVFEMASMTLEIVTSRAISAQILRHRSFSFQEFSQRYAAVQEVLTYPARRQDDKNRQASHDDLPQDDRDWFLTAQKDVAEYAQSRYEEALCRGVAKECARFLLPMATKTVLYMHGTVRSWIHYLQARTAKGVQLEHRELALSAQDIFRENFPAITRALEW